MIAAMPVLRRLALRNQGLRRIVAIVEQRDLADQQLPIFAIICGAPGCAG